MTDDERQPDVGKYGVELRLWVAAQAVRHAELRLASQAAHRTAIETRAASILGWSVTLTLAALTLAVKAPNIATGWGAVFGAIFCFAAALAAGGALYPRRWCVAGMSPPDLMEAKLSSELGFQEAIALRYENDIGSNYGALNILGWWLRSSWLFLAAAPVASGAAAKWMPELTSWFPWSVA